jgi:hypothetical protein
MSELSDLINSFVRKEIPFEEQTPERCMRVVKECGVYLKFIDNQYDELCAEAIRQHPIYIHFVKNQTPELCMQAVKQNGHYIQFVKDQTPELCIEAVKSNPISIRFTKYKPSRELAYQSIINYKDDCLICFDNVNEWCKLSCGHQFHIPCIKECIKTRSKCPLCNQEINFTWLVM